MARGDIETNRIVRVAQKQAKRKAAPKKKVKKAPARSGGGIAGVSVAVARRQTTPKQVVRRTRKAGRPAPKQRAQQGSRSLDEAFAKLGLGGDNTKTRGRDVQTGGLPDRLQLLRNNSPDSFFGGLLKNTARGALDTVTGLPAAGQLIGENLAAFNPVVGPLRLVPGLDAVDRFQNRVAGTDVRAGKAVAESYKYKYGPALRGDFGTTGKRIYDDPFGTALDLATVYGAAGRAGNIGSKITRAAAPGSRAAARVSRRLSVAPAVERQGWIEAENAARAVKGKRPIPFEPGQGGRYRPPRVYRDTTPAKRGEIAEARIEVQRPPYSANRITAAVQRRIDRGATRRQDRIDERAGREPSTVPVFGPVRNLRTRAAGRRTTAARFQRAQADNAREARYMGERRAEAMVANTSEYKKFVRAERSLHKDKTPAGIPERGLSTEQLALRMHLDDLVDPRGRGGLTPVQMRDRAVNKWLREQADAGFDMPKARAQAEKVKQIPEELLTLKGDSPAVQRLRVAIQSGRDLDRVNQQRQLAAGVISEKTAADMKGRMTSIILGDSEWLPNRLRRMKQAGASRPERAAAREREIASDPRVQAARGKLREADKRVAAASRTPAASPPRPVEKGRTEVYLDAGSSSGRDMGGWTKAEIVGDHLVVNLNNRGGPAAWAVVKRDTKSVNYYSDPRSITGKLDNPEGRVPKPGEHRVTYDRDNGSRGLVSTHRTKAEAMRAADDLANRPSGVPSGPDLSEVRAATRARDKAKARASRVEKRAAERLTQPDRPELVGNRGVYIPRRAVDNPPAKSSFQTGRGFSGPQKVKRERGTLARTGNFDMSPNLLAHQARRAAGNVTGPMSPRALKELIDTAGYKVDGKLAKGQRAWQVLSQNPEKVVLINAKSLQRTMRKLDKLEEGKYLDDADARIFYGEPRGAEWVQDIKQKAVTGDYVAISKGAAEAWRESMTAPWKWLEKYDNALDLWKGGLLALSPRWYTTNLVGLGFQYGILAGGDIRAIWKGFRSPAIRRAIGEKNPDVALSTLADELTSGFDPRKFEDASAAMAVIRGGYKVNNAIEAGWRRAAYLNRAKKMMRDEGGRFRGMTDAELAAAIDRMPQSVARNIVRDVDFYIGEYSRFKPWERQLAKRIVPFYSWMRVIGRLTLGLPFRSPLRAAAMAVLAKAATAGINPNDYMLPVYARGALNVGKYKVPTYSLNPFQSLAPFIEGVGGNNPLGGVLKAGVGWATPAVQFPVNQGFGLNNFGEGVFAPPGAGDTAQQFGRDPQEWNAATGRPEDATIRIPMSEALLQTLLPGFVNPLRRALIGEETAFDTTTTPDLLGLTGKPRSEKFYQRKGPRARKPAAVNPFTSFLGAPLYEQDDALIAKQYRKALKDYQDAVRQTKRRKKKAGR